MFGATTKTHGSVLIKLQKLQVLWPACATGIRNMKPLYSGWLLFSVFFFGGKDWSKNQRQRHPTSSFSLSLARWGIWNTLTKRFIKVGTTVTASAPMEAHECVGIGGPGGPGGPNGGGTPQPFEWLGEVVTCIPQFFKSPVEPQTTCFLMDGMVKQPFPI